MDGTEKLCNILYGVNMGAPKHYLGGSNALMLHDAADKIAELQAQVDRVKGVRNRILTEISQLEPHALVHLDIAEWIEQALDIPHNEAHPIEQYQALKDKDDE